MSRPEWVKCALRTDHPTKTTWCGRRIVEFAFVDLEHAALNGAHEGRLVLCRQCYDAGVKALAEGIDFDEPKGGDET